MQTDLELEPVMEWFVLQALTGQEQKVEKLLKAQSKEQGLDIYIQDVRVPVEKVVKFTEDKSGKKRKTNITKKLYPGYVFINAAVYYKGAKRGERPLNEPVWSFIRGIQGVIGFLGGEQRKPQPLSAEEMTSILGASEAGQEAKVVIPFEVGDEVKIKSGPFVSSTGIVQEIDPEKGELKVNVTIFGRDVLTTVGIYEVEKVIPEETDVAPIM